MVVSHELSSAKWRRTQHPSGCRTRRQRGTGTFPRSDFRVSMRHVVQDSRLGLHFSQEVFHSRERCAFHLRKREDVDLHRRAIEHDRQRLENSRCAIGQLGARAV